MGCIFAFLSSLYLPFITGIWKEHLEVCVWMGGVVDTALPVMAADARQKQADREQKHTHVNHHKCDPWTWWWTSVVTVPRSRRLGSIRCSGGSASECWTIATRHRGAADVLQADKRKAAAEAAASPSAVGMVGLLPLSAPLLSINNWLLLHTQAFTFCYNQLMFNAHQFEADVSGHEESWAPTLRRIEDSDKLYQNTNSLIFNYENIKHFLQPLPEVMWWGSQIPPSLN